MIVSLLVVGAIAWVLTGAVEDTIRAGRGDAPSGPRKGFRGYLDDRWAALADRHHTNKEAGLLSAGDSWAHRRHLARKKALALRGYKTDEDIARAAYHHRRRLGLIGQGIEPDTAPPPPGAPALKRNRRMMPDRDAHGKYKAPKEKESKKDLDTTDVIGLTDLDQTNPEPKKTNTEPTEPQDTKPWTPFTDDPKENTNMTVAGEINNPADVKAFADAMRASLDATTSTIDTLGGITAGLANRVTDHAANALAAENAAAGMDRLGMTDAAAAARALIEQQQQIQTALQAIVDALATGTAAIADQVEAARPGVDAITRAYNAQLSVADTRAGVGRGNLAADAYLDGDV
jgi:hypothetical protein